MVDATMTASEPAIPNEDQYLQYRTLSGLAVAAFIFGLLSTLALIIPAWIIWAGIGILVGLLAYFRIRGRRHELTGYWIAVLGLALSILSVIGGIGISAYTYATEVPEGYTRISFNQLQPEKGSGLPIPASAKDLNGKKIFVPGYVHKAVDRPTNIKRFILVPDMKTCCFGGQPELTDMIEVTLQDPLRINYSFRKRRLGGTLKVSDTKKTITGLDGVYYELDADYLARPGT